MVFAINALKTHVVEAISNSTAFDCEAMFCCDLKGTFVFGSFLELVLSIVAKLCLSQELRTNSSIVD